MIIRFFEDRLFGEDKFLVETDCNMLPGVGDILYITYEDEEKDERVMNRFVVKKISYDLHIPKRENLVAVEKTKFVGARVYLKKG
jgi:hypothetical protein